MAFIICFIGTMIGYAVIYSITLENIVPKYEEAKEQYFKSIARDIKKFAISDEELQHLAPKLDPKSNISSTFCISMIVFFLIAGVSSIVAVFILGSAKHNDIRGTVAFLTFFAVWIFGIFYAYSSVAIDIKNGIFRRMEESRCPHCHAPFGYKHIDSYRSDEQHYLKRVEKREGSVFDKNSFTYHTNVPMTSYTLHSVYQCYFCKMKDENTREIENETGSFGDNLGKALIK